MTYWKPMHWTVLALVGILIAPIIQPYAAAQAASAQEAPLSNADIIKLSKLQLGDEVIIAKIKQAKAVGFDLSTDGLVQLKQGGVSGAIIAAMLDRSTSKPPAAPAAPVPGNAFQVPGQEVQLIDGDQAVNLPSNRGDLSVTGMWPVVFTFLDYPGRFARTRVQNRRPTLVVRSPHDPKGYYYLARLDVNDEEDNNRSLKIEQKASGFTATTRVIPAGRWHVEYDAAESEPGIWNVTPTRDLEPGEYGVVVPGGILYEFGID